MYAKEREKKKSTIRILFTRLLICSVSNNNISIVDGEFRRNLGKQKQKNEQLSVYNTLRI